MIFDTKFEIIDPVFLISFEEELDTCPSCRGTGTLKIHKEGSPRRVECYRCHSIGNVRLAKKYIVREDYIDKICVEKNRKGEAVLTYELVGTFGTKTEQDLYSNREEAQKVCDQINESELWV